MLGIDHHHVGHVGDHRERNEIALQAVRQLGVEGFGDRVMHRAHEPGVAVGQRLGRGRRADGAACASLVLDEHGLAEAVGELYGERPRESIGSPARGKGIDDAHGPRGPALRERGAGQQREQNGGNGRTELHEIWPPGMDLPVRCGLSRFLRWGASVPQSPRILGRRRPLARRMLRRTEDLIKVNCGSPWGASKLSGSKPAEKGGLMPLVAMTREMGSLGMDVARILESELRVPVVYHEMINNLADKMRLRKSHVIRLLGGKANLFERLTADKTSLSIYTADEMLQVASKGAVMRGWGAAHLLRPVKHAICVRICAPFELRVKRMMERLDTNDRDAVAAEIRNSDEAQGAIAKRHFAIDWQEPEGYDLSLNTERMSVDQCAEEIIQLSRKPDFIETDESHRALSDLALQASIKAALRADPSTRGLTFGVDSEGGRVRLRGIVDTREEWKNATRVVTSVHGVTGVKSELRVTAEIRSPMGE